MQPTPNGELLGAGLPCGREHGVQRLGGACWSPETAKWIPGR